MIIYRDRQAEAGDRDEGKIIVSSFIKVFKIRDVWLLSLFNALLTTSIMSVNTLLPITLEEKGIQNAGGIVSVMMFSALIFTIIGGVISDRFGKRKMFLIMGGIVTGLCIPCLIIFKGPFLILALIIAGAFSLPAGSIVFSAAVEVEGASALVGTSLGLINMIGTLGGFVGPIIAGMLIDVSGLAWPGFIFMAVSVITGGLILIPSKLK